MNRRDLLKRMLALPLVAAPVAIAAPMLSESSLEELLRQIGDWARLTGKPIAINPTWAEVFEHVWRPDAEICINCGCAALEVEEGLESKFCMGHEHPFIVNGFGKP